MKGERLRVAWLGHRSQALSGAAASYSQDSVRGLRARGVDVTFFHPGGPAARRRERRDGEEDSIALASLALMKPLVYSPPAAKRALLQRLRQGDFDLVHASFWFSSLDFELPGLCRELGLPLIATFHVGFDQRAPLRGGLSRATYRLYARSLRECERVIVFSQSQWDLLRELGLPARKLEVLPAGVDVGRYCPGPSEAKRTWGARRLFVYAGPLTAEQSVDVLVRSFLGTARDAGLRLLLVGSGPDRRGLQRAFPDPRVAFAGQVADDSDRIAILRAADGFFLPGTSDVLSRPLLEAMACGVPSVATDSGGDGEALRGAGIVLDPLRVEGELRLALRSLQEIAALRRRLGQAARRRAVERYSLDVNLERLVGLYQEVAS